VTDFAASLVASVVIMGMWLCLAAPVVYLAHRRMRRVERDLGAPALPANETPALLRAVACFAWPLASVVGLVAWTRRSWARLARDVTLIFLVQITGAVLSAIGATVAQSIHPPRSTAEEMFPLLVLACVNLGLGVLIATTFLWVWAGQRARRLRLPPARGPSPGPWRFAVYAASLLFWPLGIVLVVVFTAPENARVGAHAFRCSLVQIACIALAVSAGLPLLAASFLGLV
jgi:hypothetical protein